MGEELDQAFGIAARQFNLRRKAEIELEAERTRWREAIDALRDVVEAADDLRNHPGAQYDPRSYKPTWERYAEARGVARSLLASHEPSEGA